MSDALTLDQIEAFVAVAATGSFAAAARQLRRSPPAVTYVVQKIEEQLGVTLFDRRTYRASLTDEGRALLPRARRVVEEMKGLRVAARGISDGLESEVTIAVDSMFPVDLLMEPLCAFQSAFPTVQIRIHVETFSLAASMVRDATAALGITADFRLDDPELVVVPLIDLATVMVASPGHPLSQIDGPIDLDRLRDHVQLVITDRSRPAPSRDWAVYSATTWRIGDLYTKRALLRAGLGFGSLPEHVARPDIVAGSVVELAIPSISQTLRPFPLALIRRVDRPLWPGARWLVGKIEDRMRVERADVDARLATIDHGPDARLGKDDGLPGVTGRSISLR